MQRWEYLTIYIYGRAWFDSLGRTGETPYIEITSELVSSDSTALLNDLGEQGWDLVGVAFEYSPHRLFLERPRE